MEQRIVRGVSVVVCVVVSLLQSAHCSPPPPYLLGIAADRLVHMDPSTLHTLHTYPSGLQGQHITASAVDVISQSLYISVQNSTQAEIYTYNLTDLTHPPTHASIPLFQVYAMHTAQDDAGGGVRVYADVDNYLAQGVCRFNLSIPNCKYAITNTLLLQTTGVAALDVDTYVYYYLLADNVGQQLLFTLDVSGIYGHVLNEVKISGNIKDLVYTSKGLVGFFQEKSKNGTLTRIAYVDPYSGQAAKVLVGGVDEELGVVGKVTVDPTTLDVYALLPQQKMFIMSLTDPTAYRVEDTPRGGDLLFVNYVYAPK